MDYKIKGETLIGIADAIRAATNSDDSIKPEEMASKVESVYEAGKAQRDYEWWDYYQSQYWAWNGKVEGDRVDYTNAFYGGGWRDDNYNPIRPITATSSSQSMFSYSIITDTKVDVSIAGTNATNKSSTFANASELVTVRKFIVNELQGMSNHFTNCTKLENLTIEGVIGKSVNTQWCPLTKESILSVVEHLSDTATGVTATFKASAVDTAFETSEGAADGSTSAAWAALKATKPNWTFATV